MSRTNISNEWAAACTPSYLAVARKLVAYLLAVDKSGQTFQLRLPSEGRTQTAA